ncbi:hypothetical protein [Neobacillus sp. LXY-4]|uniref:hypothetical protein n=1 Tax=Neobacillus sp. LXY-4 TaxID=3379826 RepID=UPI003EE00A4D
MLKKLAAVVAIWVLFANFALPNVKAAESFPVDQFPYKEMQIQVMPEFDYPEKWPEDQPSLLVGYYGTFTNKTGKDFNGEIEFPAPVNDKNFEVYLVAEFPSDDEPEIQRPFEVNKDKGVVTWKPSKAIKNDKTYRFVIEYYTNPFEVTDSKKFTFNYVNPVETEKLDIIMYSPVKAEDFKIDPAAANTSESEYGEKLYYYQYTNVKKNEPINLNVSYVKKDNKSTLSVLSEQAPPNDENHSGVSGDTATDQVLNNSGDNSKKTSDQPIIGIGGATVIGISIIIAGVFVFLGLKGNTRNSKPSGTSNKKTQKKTVAEKSAPKVTKKDSQDQKKKLRSLLVNGEIDEETYEREIKKLG